VGYRLTDKESIHKSPIRGPIFAVAEMQQLQQSSVLNGRQMLVNGNSGIMIHQVGSGNAPWFPPVTNIFEVTLLKLFPGHLNKREDPHHAATSSGQINQ